jgi:beta-1,4-mannosyl-glycoprotein beta-1,4-N-acetylglucosaminyltransferase
MKIIGSPNYYTNGLNSTHLCELHGWQRRAQEVQVIDTIIFSIELDLLEIRLKELWPFVDHFIVLEADRGFTGRPKPLYLNRSLDRFSWAKDKLRYHSYGGLTALMPGEGPFKNEAHMRGIMNGIVAKYARNGDAIICSDVDEIPSRQTVRLLKECIGFANHMHLQLNMYFYSFVYFFSTDDSWRAHIDIYDHEFSYRHGRLSDTLLADSGNTIIALLIQFAL